jgi:hypothetical protein
MADYDEYTLSTSKDHQPHHILKVPSTKFNIASLKPPITLTRQKQKPLEEEVVNPYFKKKTKALFLGRDEVDERDQKDAGTLALNGRCSAVGAERRSGLYVYWQCRRRSTL